MRQDGKKRTDITIMENKKQFIKGIAVGVVVTAVAAGGIFFGSRELTKLSDEKKAERGELNLTSTEVEEKITEIETLIQNQYLNEIDADQVEKYLYKGIIAGLGDTYGAYYTKEEYQNMKDSTSGSYSGIGVEMSQNTTTGIITITQVFEGSPAEEAGLLAGDVLYMVEDQEVTGGDLTQIVSVVKGTEGTTVSISVAREGEDDFMTFDVERRTIELTTVSHKMLDGNIGYISVSNFENVTVNQFLEALDDLENQGETALIIDLRNNTGGLVSSACSILDRLLPEGLIVYTEDKYGNREESRSDAENYFDKPLVLLVNEYSASASEIFAGAIKDYGIGTLVGTQTFGKGIVQKIFPLSDGTAVKLTVSKYYTPNGNNIQDVGITPDVEVELDEDVANEFTIPEDKDNQLQKAIEILSE